MLAESIEPNLVQEPRVVVLMSVHAGANPKDLDVALASMRSQTHRNLRLLIYCDGPVHAEHEEVFGKYLEIEGGSDLLVRGQQSLGLASGLNRLIDLALEDPLTECLARMDADDISMPERIARQIDFLDTNPDVSVVGTWCIEFIEPNVPLSYKKPPFQTADVSRYMLYRNPLVHPAVMFRRSIFEKGYRYNSRFLVMQDYEFWSRLIVAGEVLSNVPENLLWFRMGSGFFKRRHGMNRAWTELKLRLDFARRSHLLRPIHLVGFLFIFLVRILPDPIKRLAYKYLR